MRLVRSGQGAQALALVRQGLAARPGDPLIAVLARRIQHHRIPTYPWAMLRDRRRNAASRQAIEALAPGRVVLGIGSGSGLLAMLAARTGAAQVHACEVSPMLAIAGTRDRRR